MADDSSATNLVESLTKDEIQSVTSNGVSVTLRGPEADKTAEETETLKTRRSYNPLNAMFRADKWSK